MDLHGVTPLMLACRNFELETIQQILNQNPLANCADRSNSTALHYLSKTSFREDTHVVAETLLKLNVDVNAKDSHGTTALCYACENLCYNLVETLVLNGADVCFRDKCVTTTRCLACKNILRILRLFFNFLIFFFTEKDEQYYT